MRDPMRNDLLGIQSDVDKGNCYETTPAGIFSSSDRRRTIQGGVVGEKNAYSAIGLIAQ